MFRIFVFCFASLLICNFAWAQEGGDAGNTESASESAEQSKDGDDEDASKKNKPNDTGKKLDKSEDSMLVEQFSEFQNLRIELIKNNIKLLDEMEKSSEFDRRLCLENKITSENGGIEKCATYKDIKDSVSKNLKALNSDVKKANKFVNERANHELNKAKFELEKRKKKIPEFRDHFLKSLLWLSLLICVVEFLVHVCRTLKLGVKDLKEKLKIANEQIETIQGELGKAKEKIDELEKAAAVQGFSNMSALSSVQDQVGKADAETSVLKSSLSLLGKFTINTPWYGPIMLGISLLFYVVTVGGINL